jgi:hypothetical protein
MVSKACAVCGEAMDDDEGEHCVGCNFAMHERCATPCVRCDRPVCSMCAQLDEKGRHVCPTCAETL